jgi:uroporphyrinogen decarboxylase
MVTKIIPRELVRLLFSPGEELPRIPFIPLIFGHAARLEQITLRQMFTDPAHLTRALQNAQKLYNYDVIICPFDSSLEAEACGCQLIWKNDYQSPSISRYLSSEAYLDSIDVSDLDKKGRMPVVLEALRRLKIVSGKNVAIAAVVTGPVTLATKLGNLCISKDFEQNIQILENFLRFAASVSLRVCKAFCEIQPDIIFIAEEHLNGLPLQLFSFLSSFLTPLVNMCTFYNVHHVLITKIEEEEKLNILQRLNIDGVVLKFTEDNIRLLSESAKNLIFGIGIPHTILEKPETEIVQFLEKNLTRGTDKRIFLTTEWEVPLESKPENIHKLVRGISAFY